MISSRAAPAPPDVALSLSLARDGALPVGGCADVVILMLSLARDVHSCAGGVAALQSADLRSDLRELVDRVAAQPTRPTVLLVPPLPPPLPFNTSGVAGASAVAVAPAVAYEIVSEYVRVSLRELVESSAAADVLDWAAPSHRSFEALWRFDDSQTCSPFRLSPASATAAAKRLGEFIHAAHSITATQHPKRRRSERP